MTYGHFNFYLYNLLGLSDLYNSRVNGDFMEETGYNITQKEFKTIFKVVFISCNLTYRTRLNNL